MNFGKRKYKRRKRYISQRDIKRIEQKIVNIASICLIVSLFFLVRNIFFKQTSNINIPLNLISAMQIPNKTMVDLKALSEKYSLDFPELCSIYCLESDFLSENKTQFQTGEIEQKIIMNYSAIKKKYDKKSLDNFTHMFKTLFDNFVYFPIPKNFDEEETESYMFGDNWNHREKAEEQGADILDRENIKGRIPIVAISEGKIEKIEFSEESGYTMALKSQDGVTFTYSAMDNFFEPLKKGAQIKPGQQIGHMGNTGKFGQQVRLKLFVTIETELSKNPLPINPYPFLRLIEETKVDFAKK